MLEKLPQIEDYFAGGRDCVIDSCVHFFTVLPGKINLHTRTFIFVSTDYFDGLKNARH
jgi:hypothetical protein